MSEERNKYKHHPLYYGNASNQACHPNAPNGGGGCGAFTQAGPLDCSDDIYSSLPHPFFPAALYLTHDEIAKVAKEQAKTFSIRSIPGIMRYNKWYKGATLMDSWFTRNTKTAPDYDFPDTTTITMDWVLGFERALDVYNEIISERIWLNAAAQKEIANMLKRKGFITPNSCFSRSFGTFNLPVSQLDDDDDDAINYRKVGMSWIDLDAALGNFVFKVIVSGNISSDEKPGKYKVEITHVGVYVKDSYDFNGEQFLGYWDDSDDSVSMTNPLSGTGVSNQNFRDWRSKNKKGGDFRVFRILSQNLEFLLILFLFHDGVTRKMQKSQNIKWLFALISLVSLALTVLILNNSQVFREEYATFMRPDRHYKVRVMRNKMWIGHMPGQGSDNPGVVLLLDKEGNLLHQTDVEMVQLVEHVNWQNKKASIKLVADWDLPD